MSWGSFAIGAAAGLVVGLIIAAVLAVRVLDALFHHFYVERRR